VVKAIADAHGGHVACTASTLGGARFVIELPRQ
jgi:two-component system sensor histidine kinase AdeS